jgi:hypothetical protein
LTDQHLSWRALSSRDLGPAISSRALQVFGVDLRSLALMRIGLGAVLVADLLQRFSTLKAHYTDEGVLPRALMQGMGMARIGLYGLAGGATGAIVLGSVSLVSAVALALGFQTRVATIASWVLLVSLQNRNPFVYHSGDDLLRLLLFWGMFLPLGACWSLDARRRPEVSAAGPTIVSVGSLGLFVQLFSMFLFLFDHKLMGTAWQNGTAVYDALSVEQYTTALGSALLRFPSLLPLLTYAVLVQQGVTLVLLASPILVGPIRLLAILGVIATQIAFGLCFRLGTFPWITSIAMLAMLPPWFWQRLDSATRGKTGDRDEQTQFIIPVPLSQPSRLARVSKAAVVLFGVLCIASMTLWNLSQAGARFNVGGGEVAFEDTLLGGFTTALRLDQRWSMFSPNPQTEDGWFVVAGTLSSGASVDLFPALVSSVESGSTARAIDPGPPWQKPRLISSQFPSQRWLLYFLQLVGAPTDAQLRGFEAYVCRSWNASHSSDGALRRFTLDYLRFEHLADGKTSSVQKIQLTAKDCRGPSGRSPSQIVRELWAR